MLAVTAIGDNPTDGSEQEHRNLAGESNRAQFQPRTRQPVYQPRLRHGLHPSTDQGNQLSTEKKLEVAMPQRSSRRMQGKSSAFGGGSAVPGFVLLNGSLPLSHDLFG